MWTVVSNQASGLMMDVVCSLHMSQHCTALVHCLTVLAIVEWLRERTDHLNIFLFLPITQWCSISDVLFTGGRECQIIVF